MQHHYCTEKNNLFGDIPPKIRQRFGMEEIKASNSIRNRLELQQDVLQFLFHLRSNTNRATFLTISNF
jgi:hypothetical protein